MDVVNSQQLTLLVDRARGKWLLADTLVAEENALSVILSGLRAELLWLPLERRGALLDRVSRVEETHQRTMAAWRSATDAALVASEQAAAVGWGVKLGHRYRLEGRRFPEPREVVVESLRPTERSALGAGMLCTVRDGKSRILVILGHDDARLTHIESNIISLQPRLAARRAPTSGAFR